MLSLRCPIRNTQSSFNRRLTGLSVHLPKSHLPVALARHSSAYWILNCPFCFHFTKQCPILFSLMSGRTSSLWHASLLMSSFSFCFRFGSSRITKAFDCLFFSVFCQVYLVGKYQSMNQTTFGWQVSKYESNDGDGESYRA